eukprot:g40330.t1
MKSLLEKLSNLEATYTTDTEKLRMEVDRLRANEEIAKVSSNKITSLLEEITILRKELKETQAQKKRLEEGAEKYKEETELMVSQLKEQNTLLKNEKEDLNRQIQEQAKEITGIISISLLRVTFSLARQRSLKKKIFSASGLVILTLDLFAESMEKRMEEETKQLQVDLNDERSRYQSLLNEFCRLEERYDNLKEEISLVLFPAPLHLSITAPQSPFYVAKSVFSST